MLRWTRALGAAAVLAAAALLIGCEDTPLTPGEGWTLTIVAQPSVVTLENGEATSTLVVTVANDTGVPQSGISVIFSNAGGELSPENGSVETDGAGRATATLTVRQADPESIDVVASSGALSDTVTVTKSDAPENEAPTAVITAFPLTEQVQGQTVVFDGSGSSDPEGGGITMYRWRITSTNPDSGTFNPREFEGPTLESISIPSTGAPAFDNVQDLSVKLSITDDPTAPQKFELGRPFSYRSEATISYKIVAVSCASNTRPVAVIAGAETQSIPGNGQATVDVQLNGTLSHDAETDIGAYTWSCGNGAAPPLSQPVVTCTYPVGTTSRTFTATLVVSDQGNGSGQCIQTSTQDSVSIVVLP